MIERPKTESEFQMFLNRHQIQYDRQVSIDRCPFNKSFTHKVDFFLEKFDLYVEVKGWMSCAAVSELWWLLNHSGKQFYIYQATNEDWMGRCEGDRSKKIEDNKCEQQQELEKLFSLGDKGNDEVKRLVALNRRRLKAFVNVRKWDVKRWQEVLRQKNVATRLQDR